jgi:hypothetical protein
MKRRGHKLSLAAMLGLMAGMGGFDIPAPVEYKPKKSNKMPLTEDEKAHLATLKGKPKKIYVKKLREKYK